MTANTFLSAIFSTILLATSASYAGPVKFNGAGGFSLGPNMTTLFSDQTTGILGVGVANQYSLYASFFRDHPIGVRVRYDWFKGRQQALARSETDWMSPETRFDHAEESWTILSVNAEKISRGPNYDTFWELGLGLATGHGGNFSIKSGTFSGTYEAPITNSTYLAITGGYGAKKAVWKELNVSMEVRSFFIPKTIFAENDPARRTLLVIPLMLDIGIEWEFDLK